LSPCAEEVAIPSAEATLKALLFKPVGLWSIPAAVGLHGYGGLDPVVGAPARGRA
jgi:dienelactone hydrolase